MDRTAVDVIRKLEAALRRHKETGKWITWTASASAPSDVTPDAGKPAASRDTGRGGSSKGPGKPGGKGGARAAAASSKAGDGGRESDAGRITDVNDCMQQFELDRYQLGTRTHYSHCLGWVASSDHSMSVRLMDGREGNPPSLQQVLDGTGASVHWLEHAVSVLPILVAPDDDPRTVLGRYMDENESLQQDPAMAALSNCNQDEAGFCDFEFDNVQNALMDCDPSLQHLSDADVIEATKLAMYQVQLLKGHTLLMQERGLVGPELWPAGIPPFNAHPLFWSWAERAEVVVRLLVAITVVGEQPEVAGVLAGHSCVLDVAVSPRSDVEVTGVLAQALARAVAARKAEAEACAQSATPDELLAAQLRLDIADIMTILSEANVLTSRLLSPIMLFLAASRGAQLRGGDDAPPARLRFDRESLLAELRQLELDQLRSLRVVLLGELGGFRGEATRVKLRAALSASLASHNIRFGAALGSGGGSSGKHVVVREDSLAHAAAWGAHCSGDSARALALDEWRQEAAMPCITASWHLPVARQPKWPLPPALGTRAAEDALVDFIFDPTVQSTNLWVSLMPPADTTVKWVQTMEWIACLSWNASQLSDAIHEVCLASDSDLGELLRVATTMVEGSKFWQRFVEWRCEMLDMVAGLARQKELEFSAVAESEKQKRAPASKAATASQSKGRAQAKDDKREAEGSQAMERERSATESVQHCCDTANHYAQLSASIRSATNTPGQSFLRAMSDLNAVSDASTHMASSSTLMASLDTAMDECVACLKNTIFMVDHMAVEIQVTFTDVAMLSSNMECALIQEPHCWESLLLSWRGILGAAAKSSNALALVEEEEADVAKKKADEAAKAQAKKAKKSANKKAAPAKVVKSVSDDSEAEERAREVEAMEVAAKVAEEQKLVEQQQQQQQLQLN
jgi:hypothetical protein